ncbi:ketoacyl-ACP synthase III family protein [Streptomyces sp. NPDC057620]|uniref:Ketoacyl-ACP synthase III family protein n=2 Tax=Streptomyces TaxID=1883 RepID=A0A940XR57_9ACTN|nr:ketoacyl-ACP synthase III family protein [Streptomyces liliiviolaceus]MBQ0850489.1 ketoacyl-ACP synthase III family protein [Streptomyces liliiviolaceus]
MKLENIYLAGVGTYIPELVPVEQAVKDGLYSEAEHEASGMESVAIEDTLGAPDMAIRAAEVAIRRSGHHPDDFAALLHSTTFLQGPHDGWSPSHYILLNALDRPISATVIQQGCNGLMTGIEMAAHRLIAADDKDAVLVTGADNFNTPMVDRWRASGLFFMADSGSAIVVSRRSGFAKVLAVGSVSDPKLEWRHRAEGSLMPPREPSHKLLDFETRVKFWQRKWADGTPPPGGNFIDLLSGVAERTLGEVGLTMDDVARVTHVGFHRDTLHALYLEPLGIDADRGTWERSRQIGHASMSDVVIGLEHLWLTRQVNPGDRVLMIGTTPGMEVGCAVVEITEGPDDA